MWHDSIVNAFYLVLLLIIVIWKLSSFYKLQWQHFTGEVYKFIIYWCDISSALHIPKITHIYSSLTELFKIVSVSSLFWSTVYVWHVWHDAPNKDCFFLLHWGLDNTLQWWRWNLVQKSILWFTLEFHISSIRWRRWKYSKFN